MQQHWLTIVVFLPLLGALVLLAFPSSAREGIRRTALGFSILTFAVALPLYFWFDTSAPGLQLLDRHRWITAPGFQIDYLVGIDGLSLFLVLLTAFLLPVALLASWPISQRVREFFILLLVLETGLLGVFVALDMFLFYVFWEVVLIPMYLIIGVWGHERRRYAAIKFILYTMLGSLLMLVAIIWLSTAGGTFNLLTLINARTQGSLIIPASHERWLFLAFFLAFAIKVPLFPFHTWLPDAHVEAPTAGSVILAGVLLKMGGYGLLRFCLPLFPTAVKEFAPAISALAIIGILYGALVSMVQPDMKKLIAYSSVSHMGFVVLGIFAFNDIGIEGAIFLMLGHGLSTGVLFLIAGMFYDRRHTHLIRDFGGLATPLPALSAFFLIACLASLGLPPLVNWAGEFMVLVGVFRDNIMHAVLAALGVVLAAVYLLWMYQRVIYGEVTNDANRNLPDASRRELAILIPMIVMIVFMGLASPLFTRPMAPTAKRILIEVESTYYELAETPAPRSEPR
jgi:NADH-quinone oxidoreductase subunit M